MSNQDLQNRLEQGISGNPQLKPDEKRKYLGNFRERVYLVLTMDEVKQAAAFLPLKEVIQKFPNHQLFINGKIPSQQQKKLMQLARERNCRFTIVDTSLPENKTDIAVVYAGNQPSGRTAIRLQDVAADTTKSIKKEEKKKTGFWNKLFSTTK